jgi:NADPH:quinone reductase-like Zn-dependent oxidoreductase
MKGWRESRYAVDTPQVAERSVPEPGAEQILVRVGAASLNYRDKLATQGKSATNYDLPFVPASDAAGTTH